MIAVMTRRSVSEVLSARRLTRVCAIVTLVVATLAVTSTAGWAQRAPGGVTIYDEPGCSGVALLNEAKVTVPFSILATGLTPFSTTSQAFATDLDAQPNIRYGPITIPAVGSDGTVCAEVLSAPAGRWKIEVIEEGSGFTDSKVFTIEPSTPPPTTATPTTAPPTHRAAEHRAADAPRRRGPRRRAPRRRAPRRRAPRRRRTAPPTTAPPTTAPPTTAPPTTAPPTTAPPTHRAADHYDGNARADPNDNRRRC